jgi:hypothetical protein
VASTKHRERGHDPFQTPGICLYQTLRRQYAIARARELAGERLPFGRGGSFVRGAAFVYAPDGRYVARADWRPGGRVEVEIGRST